MKDTHLYPVVDENDEVIGYKLRYDITTNDIYRVAALWIVNSKGNILLTKRVATKTHDPDKWQPAVAGTVEKDESYLENVIKETKEEIGVDVNENELVPWPKHLRRNTPWNYFAQMFTYKTDKKISEFIPKKYEVAGIKWFSPDDIEKLLKESPDFFVKSFPSTYAEYKNNK
jgi:isopentenyl-diphosphate delta-isomerase